MKFNTKAKQVMYMLGGIFIIAIFAVGLDIGETAETCTNGQIAKVNGTTWACMSDSVGSGGKNTDGYYIYNDSNTIRFNESKMNDTIDARAPAGADNTTWNQSLADSLYYDNVDTNVTTACNTGEVLLGDGQCIDLNGTIDQRDDDTTYSDLSEFTNNLLFPQNDSDAFFRIIFANDWSNVTITESQITDLVHTTDTNESVRFNNLVALNCTGEVIAGVWVNGTPICEPDDTGDVGSDTNVTTACSGAELLMGNGSCQIATNFSTVVTDIWVDEAGDTMTGNIDMNLNNISNVRKIILGNGTPTVTGAKSVIDASQTYDSSTDFTFFAPVYYAGSGTVRGNAIAGYSSARGTGYTSLVSNNYHIGGLGFGGTYNVGAQGNTNLNLAGAGIWGSAGFGGQLKTNDITALYLQAVGVAGSNVYSASTVYNTTTIRNLVLLNSQSGVTYKHPSGGSIEQIALDIEEPTRGNINKQINLRGTSASNTGVVFGNDQDTKIFSPLANYIQLGNGTSTVYLILTSPDGTEHTCHVPNGGTSITCT